MIRTLDDIAREIAAAQALADQLEAALVEAIRAKRLRRGYTQEQMAARLHLDRSTYAYYETRRRRIPPEVLDKLILLLEG